jgi:hypothetical protein
MSSSLIAQRMPLAMLLGSALALTACGSGGGSSSGGGGSGTGTVAGAAEGLWSGVDSSGLALAGVTLDTGDFWFLRSVTPQLATETLPVGTVLALVQGKGSYSGSTFTSSTGNVYWLDPNLFVAGTLSGFGGQLVAKTSFRGTYAGNLPGVGAGGGANFTLDFAMNYGAAYDQAPPSLAALAGSWQAAYPQIPGTSTFVLGTSPNLGRFQIAEFGSTGCAFNGSLTPRVSGKNVFDFSGAASQSTGTANVCSAGLVGKTFTGVAEYTLNPTGGPRILIKALDSSRGFPLVLLVDR